MFEPEEKEAAEIPTRRKRDRAKAKPDFKQKIGAAPGDPLAMAPEERWRTRKPTERERPKTDLDSEKVGTLYRSLLSHYLRELDVQGPNRSEMEQDEAYYDHDQWSEEDKEVLRSRGQEPIVYNVISTTINWILGTERRGRVDHRVLPRTENGAKPAERKSQLLKYLSDVNKSPFSLSSAFADAVKAGVGWIESGVQDEDEGEPIYDRHESWRSMLWDSMATERDLSDARFMFRTRWTDVDTATAYFPDRAETIRMAASDTYEFGALADRHGDSAMDSQEELAQNVRHDDDDISVSTRRRVRLIECWFRIPVQEDVVRGGQFSGEVFDPVSNGHIEEIARGVATVRRRTTMRMHVMVFTVSGALWLSPSPYRHNKFPFTPIWGYRRAKDRLPYGVIRGLKGMQNDINKRASKALWILSTNKVVMDAGAVDDIDALEEELARPDSIIVKRKGYSLDINADRDLAAGHMELMSRTIAMIQQTSGVTDEAMGRTTNASSGKAIIARQDQGVLSTSLLFDNLRFARQCHGEKMLSLLEQFMTEEKRFRITNERGSPEYVSINDELPENDIIRTKADYIIAEDDWSATMREAQTAQLMELLQQLAPAAPQIVLTVIDLLIEKMDVPNREDIVKRIRQVTGMEDPDADPNNPTPEMQARMARAKLEQEFKDRMALLEMKDKEATVAEKMARAQKTNVDMQKVAADAQKIVNMLPGDNLEMQRKALELAVELMAKRAAGPMADMLLEESGYDVSAPAPTIPKPGAQRPQPPAQPQPQQPQPMRPQPPQPAAQPAFA